MDAIRIDNLRKEFKPSWPGRTPVQALDGLTLSVERGEIYGFLGPNGSGKTTTLKILMGLMTASSGRAEVLGHPAGHVETRRQVGFLPESPYFYTYLTAQEFLQFYGQLAGLSRAKIASRVQELLEIVGMQHAGARQLRTFSKGMLQRVGLAQALIHDPQLVVLDEPMSGLDPVGRKQIRDVILSLRDQGKTVFFSSHIIPDVEMICDRVGVILKGRIVAEGRVDELMTRGRNHSIEIMCEGFVSDRIPELREMATRILQQGLRSLIVLPDSTSVDKTIGIIRDHGGRLISVIPHKGSLEDLFVTPTNQRD
ncbi:MAG TPA: ABC transporter ATP-binding protein [Nitrospira sp.]|nr:ABC transporter ATP-binding protein [Nitrospira sp.]